MDADMVADFDEPDELDVYSGAEGGTSVPPSPSTNGNANANANANAGSNSNSNSSATSGTSYDPLRVWQQAATNADNNAKEDADAAGNAKTESEPAPDVENKTKNNSQPPPPPPCEPHPDDDKADDKAKTTTKASPKSKSKSKSKTKTKPNVNSKQLFECVPGTPSSGIACTCVPSWPRAVSKFGLMLSSIRDTKSLTRSSTAIDVLQNGYWSCGGRQAKTSLSFVALDAEAEVATTATAAVAAVVSWGMNFISLFIY